MKLYTPGPVHVAPHILDIGAQDMPYNRTAAFSEIFKEVTQGMQYVMQTKGDVAILTASGTAAMEAAVMNCLHAREQVLVINGGTFGERWRDLAIRYGHTFGEYKVEFGKNVDLDALESKIALAGNYTVLMLTAHETSTGQLFDVKAIGELAKRYGLFFMVDAISSVCADEYKMDDWGVDVTVMSSHKALALPPGLSFVALSPEAKSRLRANKTDSLYFDLHYHLENAERGQTPYTPAIGLIMQLQQRLRDIQKQTLTELIATHSRRARDFRWHVKDLQLTIFPERSSNAMTALTCGTCDALELIERMRTAHDIAITPSGDPTLAKKLVRISHMGHQPTDRMNGDNVDLTKLVGALRKWTELPPDWEARGWVPYRGTDGVVYLKRAL